MPYCPSCHSYFRTERGVKNHLSHKFSSCVGYLDQLFTDDAMNGEVDTETIHNLGLSPSLHQSSLQQFEGTGNNYSTDYFMENSVQPCDEDDNANSLIDHIQVDSMVSQDPFAIGYPGASATYGRSSTFYEHILEKNQHVEGEEQSIFYPFSCLEDWEVGKWLESLPISMEAKDQFFHLQYVRICHILVIYNSFSNHRCRKDHCHLPQQEL